MATAENQTNLGSLWPWAQDLMWQHRLHTHKAGSWWRETSRSLKSLTKSCFPYRNCQVSAVRKCQFNIPQINKLSKVIGRKNQIEECIHVFLTYILVSFKIKALVKYNKHSMKFTGLNCMFKLLLRFTEVCNHHTIWKHFHQLKKKSHAHCQLLLNLTLNPSSPKQHQPFCLYWFS